MGLMPDVTKNQIIGILLGGIPVIANLLRAFGVYDLTDDQAKALEQAVIWAGGAGGLLILADSYLRSNRAKAVATIKAAAFTVPTEAPAGPSVDEAQGGTEAPVADTPPADGPTKAS